MKSDIRMEGLTLTVKSVKRSIKFYTESFGFVCEWDAAPHFAMLRIGGPSGPTIGLLAWSEALKEGVSKTTSRQSRAIHVEFSTDDLDGLYKRLVARGVKFHIPPHDEPWERSATAFDPDGYSIEFAQGRRGKNKPKKKK